MSADNRITLVLRPREGETLDSLQFYAQLGAPVSVGRALGVIAALCEGDAIEQLLDTGLCANIEDHMRAAADARRYRWLRDVAWDTPRQDLALRDRHQNMLSDSDLDAEIDRAMQAYPCVTAQEPQT
ncbi:hypothetical protein ACDH60_10365 [Pseudomonas ficuserectae]|uniref:Uncharacterized protein n=2 Tax=Pseudomonas amygdali pv. lachrymans TaxID=53707 RepID=A0AB37R7I9_PSEAV|nr:hypothetical protein [Pseudomonas amygdali]ARA79598.1 hypothetical protein B5U27_05695 [Pseudomonas amygdali pv. lachrymans]AXH54864.1 hypothetical protein PLA107_005600 [Pseudomonas amygdali pv. lachrymans str. M301315]KKY57479.1 hypothetical protein AAY85_13265 [Pseudomonas amygdali pv. lachrymans]KPC01819.1 Uncharacterized protein AC501_3102 [Pseudomonas amygdali pv. lachrymans]KPC19964.1 Uncharacterized protein AC499_2432 [Pseudomonas amygdali pv. lachrymans]